MKNVANKSQNGVRQESELPVSPAVEAVCASPPPRPVAEVGGGNVGEGVFLLVPTKEVFIFIVEIPPGRRFFVFEVPENAFDPVLMERMVYFFGVCD